MGGRATTTQRVAKALEVSPYVVFIPSDGMKIDPDTGKRTAHGKLRRVEVNNAL
jgi:hypothetical protein